MQYREHGETIQRPTGTSDKREAEYILQEAIGQKEGAALPPHKAPICSVIIDGYVESKATLASYRNYRSAADNQLIPFFGKYRPQHLTPTLIRSYRVMRSKQWVNSESKDTLKMRHITGSTINRELSVLRAALRDYKKEHPGAIAYIPYFPMVSERDNVRHGFITEKDLIEKLAPALPDHLRPLVVCAFYCGARCGELLALDWSEIDLTHNLIYFIHTKTKHPREAPIFEGFMRDTLLAQKRSRATTMPAVFTTADGMNRLRVFRSTWITAMRKAGFPSLRPHDLRRSANRWMRNRGIPQGVRMQIMGHRTASMDIRYGIVDRSDLDMARYLARTVNDEIARS